MSGFVDRRELWAAANAFAARLELDDAARAHRLHLLAASRRRAAGRRVPYQLKQEAKQAALDALAAPVLLARARAAYDGRLVLMKGADVAARYPDPLTRPFGDVDLFADDAPAAQAALLDAGFFEVGEPEKYEGIHHLRPLALPGLPIAIEVHSRPKWLSGLPVAPTAELLADALPGADGIHRLPPEHHAVVLAVHAWAHAPLERLGDLLDVAALAADADGAAAAALARRWGCARVFDVTLRAAGAVYLGRRAPLALGLWARHLGDARHRTVLEGHLCRHLEPAWRVPRHRAPLALAAGVLADLRPAATETWADKAARARRALRSAGDAKPHYDRRLAPAEAPARPRR